MVNRCVLGLSSELCSAETGLPLSPALRPAPAGGAAPSRANGVPAGRRRDPAVSPATDACHANRAGLSHSALPPLSFFATSRCSLYKVMSKCLEQTREELHEVEGRLRRAPITNHSGAVARFQSYRRKMESREFDLPKAVRKLKHSRMETEGDYPPARGRSTPFETRPRAARPRLLAPGLLPSHPFSYHRPRAAFCLDMLKRVDAAEPSSEPSSPGLHSSDEEDDDEKTKRERAERRRIDARDERRRRHPYPIQGGGPKTFQAGSNYVHLGPGTYSGRGVDELGGIEADDSVTLPFRNQEPRCIDIRY